MMNHILRNYLIDRSDRQQHRFSLICPVCGRQWDSSPMDVGEDPRAEEGEARDEASRQAAAHFRICVLCGEPACPDCTTVLGSLYICGSCAKRIQ